MDVKHYFDKLLNDVQKNVRPNAGRGAQKEPFYGLAFSII